MHGEGTLMLVLAAIFLGWLLLKPPPATTTELEAARQAREELGTQGPPRH
jgi:hypothetical protein